MTPSSRADRACDVAAISLARWLAVPPPQRGVVVGQWVRNLEQLVPELATFATGVLGASTAGFEGEMRRSFDAALRQTASKSAERPGAGVVVFVDDRHDAKRFWLTEVVDALLNDSVVVLAPDPITADMARRLVDSASSLLPGGVLTVVEGDDESIDTLVTNPHVAKVCVQGTDQFADRVGRLATSCGKVVNRYARVA